MVVLSFLICIFLYAIFNLFGNRFNRHTVMSSAVIGCAIYFCYVQVLTFILTLAHVPLSICALILVVPLPIMLVYGCMRFRVNKSDIIIFLIGILIVIGLTIRASGYTIGSTSDSVFYISMVNENAFAREWTSLDYYTGTPVLSYFQPTYDFQGFYHLFSALMKLSAQFIDAASYYPIYIWTAQMLFQLLFIDSLIRIGIWLYHRHGLVTTIIFAGLILMNNLTCWQTLYAYIGNSWRILFITLSVYGVYHIVKSPSDNNGYWLLGIGMGATVAVTSSGLFINTFILIALFVIIGLKESPSNGFTKGWYAYAITYLFFVSYLWSSYGVISSVALLGYLIVWLIFRLLNKVAIKWRKMLVFVASIVLLLVTYGYGLFFDNQFLTFFKTFENEMGVNYFSLDSLIGFITFVLWLVPSCIILKKELKTNLMIQFFVVFVLLFVNPFSYGFYTHFLTQTVHYRCYEVFFNGLTMACLAVVWYQLIVQCKKPYHCVLSVVLSVVPLVVCAINACENPYLDDLEYTVDPIYRIDENEMEMDLLLAQEVKNSGRTRVVSQGLFTKAVVNNISLSFGNVTVRTFCYYCEPEYNSRNGEAPIFNIFLPRDYADQQLYAESPRYDQACDLLFERNFKYLLLRKDQVKEKDGVIVPIYHDLRACYSVIGENDEYVLMKSNYVQ